MERTVCVRGAGIISAAGRDTGENYRSLLRAEPIKGDIQFLSTRHKGLLSVSEVAYSNAELKEMAGLDATRKLSRTALLGLIAAREAAANAALSPEELKDCAFISASSTGGMDQTEIFYPSYLNNADKADMDLVRGHDNGSSTEIIASELGIGGLTDTISTACSSAANALLFGYMLIRSGRVRRVIAGGSDALTAFTLNGFNTLMILDPEGCKPFDARRRGLHLGEGAAYLVLEAESLLEPTMIQAIFNGGANANDAYHQTASSPEGLGAVACMTQALRHAGLKAEDISYINAHGTGTPNNDLSEGKALLKVFGSKHPPFSSTKAFTGHTLAAAGSIEAVFSLFALQNNIMFKNASFELKDEDIGISPLTDIIKDKTVRRVLSNSFGFGGNDTSLIFTKHEH